MTNFLFKAAGVCFWICALWMTSGIVKDAVGGQGAIPYVLAISAVIGSAVGSLIAHHYWRAGYGRLAAVPIMAFVLGEVYLIPIEICYWGNLQGVQEQEQKHASAVQKAQLQELQKLSESSWGAEMKSAAQIQAERDAELLKVVAYTTPKGIKGTEKTLGAWTQNCADVNHWAYRDGHCTQYVKLRVDYEAALTAEKARQDLKGALKAVSAPYVIDPHKGHKWLSRNIPLFGEGGWDDLQMVTGVLLLGFFRDATLLVTFALTAMTTATARQATLSPMSRQGDDTVADMSRHVATRDTISDKDVATRDSKGDMDVTPVATRDMIGDTLSRHENEFRDTRYQGVAENVATSATRLSPPCRDIGDTVVTPLSRHVAPVATTVSRDDDAGDSVASLVATGMTNAEIAERLGVSVRTIQRQRSKIEASKAPVIRLSSSR